MTDDQTVRHTITYPEVKEPQKPLSEKHGLSPRKSLLCFNPDGSLCIPADLKDKLVNQPLKAASYKHMSPNSPVDLNNSSGGGGASSRKRRKNKGPLRKQISEMWVPPPEGCCHFCYTADTRREMGELREVEDVRAHHSCLLFSSGLCQAGNNDEGLWGFLLPHMRKEISRGKRLKCSFCKQPGALVGCHKARCPYTYHFTCGLNNGCLMQYYENFRSFCTSHRPLQHFPKEWKLGEKAECPICGDYIPVDSKVVPRDVLVTECCNMTPLHRQCIQNQADASGYFFRCPMCNNEKKFNSIMKILGINVPQSDAVWEKEGYYDDLYVEHWRCDVPICLHSAGRSGDSRSGDQWDLMKCHTCGHNGAHPACLGFEKKGPKNWNCANCVTLQKNIDTERLEEERKAAEERAKNPPPPPPPEAALEEQSTPGPSHLPESQSTPTTPRIKASSSSSASSSRKQRWRNKTLSPSKDPFLMTPDVLKEAVFKLCVAKLKQAKLVRKDVDPDVWRGLSDPVPLSEEEAEEEEEKCTLKARPLCVLLIRSVYTPPIPAIVETGEESEEEEEKEEYNEHKETLWQIVLETRENALSMQNTDVAIKTPTRSSRGKQTKINCFFKRKNTENYTVDAKKRRIDSSENEDTSSSKQNTKLMPESENDPISFENSPCISPQSEPKAINKSSPGDPNNALKTEVPKEETVSPMKSPVKSPIKSTPRSTTKRLKLSITKTRTSPNSMPHPSSKVDFLIDSPVVDIKISAKEEPIAPPEVPAADEEPFASDTFYKCYYCSDKFTKLSVRMDHMRTSHPSRVRDWDNSGKCGKRRCLRYKQVEVIDLEVNDETAAGNEIKADEPQTKRKPGRKKGCIGRKKKRQKQKECFISKSEKDTSFITPVVEKNQRRPGRPKKRKNRVMNRNNVPNDECSEEMFTSFEEEMKKYDELTIEVEKTPQSTSDDIIQSPSEAKKEVQYDWTDDETFSLIEYYAVNPCLWYKSTKDEAKQESLITKLERKLGISADVITTKWKSLLARYKQEKYHRGSTWRFLPHLDFLEELNMTSCPDDVSPLFSLLNTAQSHDPDEVGCDDSDADRDTSQDIFPDLSDDEEADTPQYSDNESKDAVMSSNNISFDAQHISLCSEEDMISTTSFKAEDDVITAFEEVA